MRFCARWRGSELPCRRGLLDLEEAEPKRQMRSAYGTSFRRYPKQTAGGVAMKRSVSVRFCCQHLAKQWRMACIVCVSTRKSSRTSVVKASYVVIDVIRDTL